ncbi:hypothetical protein ACFYOD_18900 [Streptomyces sp. NPDC006703]|uniref:hypothetical protein n=1 Tax=Streptomyces sp. NPDC006703 TaxID=3364759 RepID=UPI00368DF93D
MIKQVLAGAAFATAATMAVAAPASAAAPQAAKAPTNALQNILAAPLAQGPTTSGTGCGCVGGTDTTGNGAMSGLTGVVSSVTGSGTTGTGTGSGTTGSGTTGSGSTGASGSSVGAKDFATRNGDTVIGGEAGGIGNTYGAPLINIDGRCLAPLPEGEGIGGHALGGPKAACNVAPVDQFQAPQKLL